MSEKPKLSVWKHEKQLFQIKLVEKAVTIGRSKSNRLCLDDKTVSTKHAEIRRGLLGYTIVDLDSRNGTRVNGKPVEGKTKLHTGDQISVGPFSLHFDPRGKEAYGARAKRSDTTIHVVCISGPDKGLEFRENLASVSVGTDRSCDIVLEKHASVRGKHAIIEQKGTRHHIRGVRGQVILNKIETEKHILGDGDFLRFGDSVFIYHEVEGVD